jgi:hypothetical protein
MQHGTKSMNQVLELPVAMSILVLMPPLAVN